MYLSVDVVYAVRGHLNRAVATGWQIGFGNSESSYLRPLLTKLLCPSIVGGIIASYAFLPKDSPKYFTGYNICISFVCLTLVTSCLYLVGVLYENSQMDKKVTDTASEGDGEEEFRYFT